MPLPAPVVIVADRSRTLNVHRYNDPEAGQGNGGKDTTLTERGMRATPVAAGPLPRGLHVLMTLFVSHVNSDADGLPLWRKNAVAATILENTS